MTGVAQVNRILPLAVIVTCLHGTVHAQPELIFLPPVKSSPPLLVADEAEQPAQFTQTLWQATDGRKPDEPVDVEAQKPEPSGEESGTTDEESVSETSDEQDPRTFLDSAESVALDAPDDEEGEPFEIFRFNEGSWDWTLRGSDQDGVGFFTLDGDGSAWGLEFDAPAHSDVEFSGGINFVSGPSRPGSDLPERLYDFGWNVHSWAPDFLEFGDIDIGLDVNFDLGIHADFEDSARNGWRFPGRVLLVSETDTDGVWLTGGFEYVDLERIQMLPAGGIVMRDEDMHLELFFPRPRIRQRVSHSGSSHDWLYVMGEYRGRGWAIERSSTGLDDVATLTEYRLAVGLESVPVKRSDDENAGDPRISFFEVSWLFGRDLEYHSGLGNIQLHDTVMFRVGSRW